MRAVGVADGVGDDVAQNLNIVDAAAKGVDRAAIAFGNANLVEKVIGKGTAVAKRLNAARADILKAVVLHREAVTGTRGIIDVDAQAGAVFGTAALPAVFATAHARFVQIGNQTD